jgi:hypothetical protein
MERTQFAIEKVLHHLEKEGIVYAHQLPQIIFLLKQVSMATITDIKEQQVEFSRDIVSQVYHLSIEQ